MLRSLKPLAARTLARLSRRAYEERRKRTLSNLDWVISTLRRVREDRPEASARWWESMRDAVLDDRATKSREVDQPR
jgi:hypothetical protein